MILGNSPVCLLFIYTGIELQCPYSSVPKLPVKAKGSIWMYLTVTPLILCICGSVDLLGCFYLALFVHVQYCFPCVFEPLLPVCRCRIRKEPERMQPDTVRGLPPPLPPRPSMRLAPSHEGIYVEPLPALEMANSDSVPMNHSRVQMSHRNERSRSLQVDPPLRNGPQRTASLQAHRWPSPPNLHPPPDSGVGRSFYSLGGSNVLPYPSRASHASERANSLQLSANTADVSSVAHLSAESLPPVAHASTTSHSQSMDYLASQSLETSDRRRSYQGTQSN